MNSKSKVLSILVVGSGLALFSYLAIKTDEGEVKTAKVMNVGLQESAKSTSPKKLSAAMKRLEIRSRKLTEKRNQALMKNAAGLGSAGGFDKQQLEAARNSVNEMIAASGTIYTEKIRGEIMDDLLESPRMIELFKKTLRNVEFAKVAFGDDQGKMRHFAVETLSYVAKSGNPKPLRDTLSSVTRGLSEKGDAVDTGEVEDLNELVIAYASNTPEEGVTKQDIMELGYSDDLPPKIATAWKSSLFLGHWKRSGDITASEKAVTEILQQG